MTRHRTGPAGLKQQKETPHETEPRSPLTTFGCSFAPATYLTTRRARPQAADSFLAHSTNQETPYFSTRTVWPLEDPTCSSKTASLRTHDIHNVLPIPSSAAPERRRDGHAARRVPAELYRAATKLVDGNEASTGLAHVLEGPKRFFVSSKYENKTVVVHS